jgi:hypothetical protein
MELVVFGCGRGRCRRDGRLTSGRPGGPVCIQCLVSNWSRVSRARLLLAKVLGANPRWFGARPCGRSSRIHGHGGHRARQRRRGGFETAVRRTQRLALSTRCSQGLFSFASAGHRGFASRRLGLGIRLRGDRHRSSGRLGATAPLLATRDTATARPEASDSGSRTGPSPVCVTCSGSLRAPASGEGTVSPRGLDASASAGLSLRALAALGPRPVSVGTISPGIFSGGAEGRHDARGDATGGPESKAGIFGSLPAITSSSAGRRESRASSGESTLGTTSSSAGAAPPTTSRPSKNNFVMVDRV